MAAATHTRYLAIKISVNELVGGMFVQEENKPNFLLTTHNQKIFRLNLIATVIQKEHVGSITNLLVDDGSGTITIRSFEENKIIEELKVGDAVLVIGKIRAYNQEKYVSPEIIKNVDGKWLKVRFSELKTGAAHKIEDIGSTAREEQANEQINTQNQNAVTEEIIEEAVPKNPLPVQKISKLIRELDSGEGALIEDLIERSPLQETEKLLQKMLESGDIFQNQPGKVKVL